MDDQELPPFRIGTPGARRSALGSPLTTVDEARQERQDCLVCLTGVLEVYGASCLGQLSGSVAVSLVEPTRLVLISRAPGLILLRCQDCAVELIGEIGIAVGSHESATLLEGMSFRSLTQGDQVRARGILRKHANPPSQGYRSQALGFALEATGVFKTIDIAYEGRPARLTRRVRQDLSRWAEPYLFPEPPASRPTPPYEPDYANLGQLAARARKRRKP